MAVSNRDRVGRALEITAEALQPFVQRHLKPNVPDGASWPTVLQLLDEQKGNAAGKVYSAGDVQVQLRVLTERLGDLGFPFNSALSRAEQNLAGELRDVRNRWAHGSPFSYDDTYRALDTAERLLRATGATGPGDQVKTLRVELQRAQMESETRRDVRESTSINGLGDVELKPWTQVLRPHDDVLNGNFKESEFAANLYSVAHHPEETSREYSDPVEFLRRTFLTHGLKDLLSQAAGRVAGRANAAPVVNLQTTFGGGKTHSMLAVWHMLSDTVATEFPQDVQEILHDADLGGGRQVRRVAVVGNELSPGEVRKKPDGAEVRTIWGEIAWQLGGRDAFDAIAESDRLGTNPGSLLRALLKKYAPCVILIDEWVAYARQLRADDERTVSGDRYPGGTFETQFSFAQTLTEAVSQTRGALLLVSIPASDVRLDADGTNVSSSASELETGGEYGKAALRRLEHVVGRVAHQWQPASAQESFEIVRRRLFEPADAQALREIAATARKFVTFYREHNGEFPRETMEEGYERKIRAAYPIHPELFDRLYEDWSTLERFQRTRGVLRLMSTVVRELHEAKDESPLIMPGSVPVGAPSVLSELRQYIDVAWAAVIDTDVDGENSLPFEIDKERPLFGKRGLTRRIARATFLGSAATLKSAHKGIERKGVFLGVAMPGDTVGNFGSSLQMLSDRASYLFSESDRYWYDLVPSLNRLVNERAETLHEEDVWAEVLDRLRYATTASGADLREVLPPATDSSDVPEAEHVRLVPLHPRYTHKNKGRDTQAIRFAHELVDTRGSGKRDRRNTVVCLAPDEQRYAELESAVRQYLAWRSVVRDRSDRWTIQQDALAKSKVDETNRAVTQRIATTWIWALYPTTRRDNDPFTMTVVKADGDETRLAVRTGRKLVKEDALRVQVAPAAVRHDLDAKLARVWNNGRIRLGDLWSYYTKYAYLPRLRDKSVLFDGVAAVIEDLGWTEQGFALATGYDEKTGDFEGLALPIENSFGPVDDDTWLVSPTIAMAQRRREQAVQAVEPGASVQDAATSTGWGGSGTSGQEPDGSGAGTATPVVVRNARYRARVEIDASEPDRVAAALRESLDEVVLHIVRARGAEGLEITLEVNAENPEGFDDATVRVVKENSRVLNFDLSEFKDVEM